STYDPLIADNTIQRPDCLPRNCLESRLRVHDSVKVRLSSVIRDTGMLMGPCYDLVGLGLSRKIRYACWSRDAELPSNSKVPLLRMMGFRSDEHTSELQSPC